MALIACRAAGLESLERSSDSIQMYQGDKELFLASLSHIQRVAAQIVDVLIELSCSEPRGAIAADKEQVAC